MVDRIAPGLRPHLPILVGLLAGLAVLAAMLMGHPTGRVGIAQGGFTTCPDPGKLAWAVWTGPDDTPIEEAVATCSPRAVAAALAWDDALQTWLFWVPHQEASNTLTTVNNSEPLFLIGGPAEAAPSPTPTLTPLPITLRPRPTTTPAWTPTPTPTPGPTRSPGPTIPPRGPGVSITGLSCDTDPEVVEIYIGVGFLGGGVELVSDPESTQRLKLDEKLGFVPPHQRNRIYSGSNAPPDNPAAGEYRWTTDFIFRDGDPTDYARLLGVGPGFEPTVYCKSLPPEPPVPVEPLAR